jgi:hypothetical protein
MYISIMQLAVYLRTKGDLSFVCSTSPKIELCVAIFRSTLLTMSPRYSPEINFSKI